MDLQGARGRCVVVWLLPSLGMLALAVLALGTSALVPVDPEPWPEYDSFDTAYEVDALELGSPITFRRDNGGDDDYLKMGFLSVDDLVTVLVDVNESIGVAIDFWASDPNTFPICYNRLAYQVGDANYFSYDFGVLMTGYYYVHTGMGVGGPTWINFTITRTRTVPQSPQKDLNSGPGQRVQLAMPAAQSGQGGLPWDPSDFYSVSLNPTPAMNKYLSLSIVSDPGVGVDWELYDMAGVLRPHESYRDDTVKWGTYADDTLSLTDFQITVAGTYVIRIWVKAGYGGYTLSVSELTYSNDHNNTVDEACEVFDNTDLVSDVNLSFDWDDYFKISLLARQPLWVWLKSETSPVDVYLVDENDISFASSRAIGLEEERIYDWAPDDGGYYYIRVSAVEESEFQHPATTDYRLKVWTNAAPRASSHTQIIITVPEDTVDTSHDVSDWFTDVDADDVLTFELDMSYSNTLVDVLLLPDNHLRIAPVANASGITISILVNASDPWELRANQTAAIVVWPVNDAPTYDPADLPEAVMFGEDLTKSGVNLTRAFRDIDDGYHSWTFKVTSTPNISVELDEETWLATFTSLVQDWTGTEYITVECNDSGGAKVSFQIMVVIYEINDPPVIGHYMESISMWEDVPLAIDLVNNAYGAFFVDPERKTLAYGWANNSSIAVSIESGAMTLLGAKDFSGVITTMTIWAVDELGARSAPMPLLIQVCGLPDPPNVTALIPEFAIIEGDSVTFDEEVYYSFYDPDSEPISLAWTWFVDEVEVPATEMSDRFAYTYSAPITAEKERTIVVRLLVEEGADFDDASWTLTVANRNQAPADLNITASDHPPYYLGDEIELVGRASDIDGDALTYTWFLDETTEMGTGAKIRYKDFMTATVHKITLKVRDTGGAVTTKDYQITIVEKPPPPGQGLAVPLALSALAALAAVVAAMAIYRRRR